MCSVSADDGPRKLELAHLASHTAIRATVSCQEPQNAEKPQKILKIRTYGNNRRTASTISGSGGTGGCVRSFCNRERSQTPVHHREKGGNRENAKNDTHLVHKFEFCGNVRNRIPKISESAKTSYLCGSVACSLLFLNFNLVGFDPNHRNAL